MFVGILRSGVQVLVVREVQDEISLLSRTRASAFEGFSKSEIAFEGVGRERAGGGQDDPVSKDGKFVISQQSNIAQLGSSQRWKHFNRKIPKEPYGLLLLHLYHLKTDMLSAFFDIYMRINYQKEKAEIFCAGRSFTSGLWRQRDCARWCQLTSRESWT